MNASKFHKGVTLWFFRWSRKGYAVFASLGREVRIGQLALHICAMSLKKAAKKGLVIVFEQKGMESVICRLAGVGGEFLGGTQGKGVFCAGRGVTGKVSACRNDDSCGVRRFNEIICLISHSGMFVLADMFFYFCC